LEGWKRVTDAVHEKGGFIYCQIWHVGRGTVPALIEGNTTLSSSDIPIKGKAVNGDEYADYPPRPMTIEEINDVVNEFADAAKRCVEEAGFDGVEIHG
jgi:2,4-dienoyl-CoA reductase-like NADH-dependent reductase (Old Yellow Enzyme family)